MACRNLFKNMMANIVRNHLVVCYVNREIQVKDSLKI